MLSVLGKYIAFGGRVTLLHWFAHAGEALMPIVNFLYLPISSEMCSYKYLYSRHSDGARCNYQGNWCLKSTSRHPPEHHDFTRIRAYIRVLPPDLSCLYRTPFIYIRGSACSENLAASTYPACSTMNLTFERGFCEIQKPEDLVPLESVARVLSHEKVHIRDGITKSTFSFALHFPFFIIIKTLFT